MIKLAALAVFSLVPVVMVGGHSPERGVPVLLMMEADPCLCAPSVVKFAVQDIQEYCDYEGSHQPCFTGQVINDPADQAGTCEAPAVAGEPPLPGCGPRSPCLFESRQVQIVAAPCASGGDCGTAPFQGLNQNGEEHGEKFTGGGEFEVKVVIGNRSCGSQPKDYDIKVMDSSTATGGVVVFHYRLRASCGQCSRLKS